jgi:Na+-translocating ferredoxin:NAD+ oxidoreductase RNF subunit RnfB
MEFSDIWIPAAILAALGAFFGIALAVASRVFAVKVDERVPQVRDALPGANCGGCGYSGCDALAAAIVEGKAPCSACPVGGDEAAAKIAAVMGVTAEKRQRMRAQVMCAGNNENALKKYIYNGVPDCVSATRLAGGDKLCAYGCLGLGSCVSACQFGALSIQNGVAVVDPDRCGGCGSCVTACPKGVIRLVPYDAPYAVVCASHEKGGVVNKQCKVGCIGCFACQKVCEAGAITINGFLAEIDPAKCTGCGACAERCVRHIILPAREKNTEK